MFRYRYDYKFLKLNINSLEVIVELSKDNTFGKMTYSAKTNLMFQDEYGDWGHAVGVGQNEEDALQMCYIELRDYLKQDCMFSPEIVNIPQKIVYNFKNNTIVLNIEENEGDFSILTPNGRKEIITNDIVKTISKNPKEFANDSITDYSEEFFDDNNFGKPFDARTERFYNEEICNLP